MEIGIANLSEEALVGVVYSALLLLGFTVWKSWHRRRKHGAVCLPPEVPGRWPIIGHLRKLMDDSGQPLARTLGALADRHGPLITLRIGVHPVVVVSSSEMVAECFTINDKAIASRPSSTAAAKYMTYNYAVLGFSPYGPYWRRIRKIATIELLSPPKLELLQHVRATEVNLSINGLYKRWRENKREARPLQVEMKQWFEDLTFNNVVMTVVGKRYHGAVNNAVDHEDGGEARRFQRAIHDFFVQVGSCAVPSDAIPILEWFDLGGHICAMKKTFQELDALCSSWLKERRLRRFSGEYGPDRDFLDVMLKMSEEINFPNYDRDTVIKATCLTMIIAGTDSTSITLTWVLSLLLNNPHALNKVQEELDAQVGKDRTVTESDIKNLPYLHAVVKETLRLHPPAPIMPYESTEDCYVGGYMIPAGTRVFVNMWNIHRNPSTWTDPLKFQPERFLTTTINAGVDMRGQNNFELIPFGTGRRVCPGISFGLQLLHLTLARLLHAFDVKTPSPDQEVDMTEAAGFSNPRASPLDVILCPRLSDSLY